MPRNAAEPDPRAWQLQEKVRRRSARLAFSRWAIAQLEVYRIPNIRLGARSANRWGSYEINRSYVEAVRLLGTWLPRTCATARPQLAKADTAFQGASVGQPTEPCLVVVGRLRIFLVHDLPLQVVVDGVAARRVHAVWSRLDPWRMSCRPQMSQRVPVGGGSLLMVCMVSPPHHFDCVILSWAARRHGRIGAYCASNRLLSPGYLAAFAPGNESRAHWPGESHFCQRRTSLKR